MDCLSLPFFVIDRYDCLLRLIVCRVCLMWFCFGCFLLNGCDFVRKKKNKGLTVHCNAAVVKPYVKMSAL